MNASFTHDVFLSHSSKDKNLVRKLAEQLRSDGFQVWFDEWEIQPGDMISWKIEQGLQKSRVLVLIMSSHAFGSDWVSLERHTILFRDCTNKQRRFIPVLLDDAVVPDTLKQFCYIDWRLNRDVAYKKLVECCRLHINEGNSCIDQYPTIPYYPYLRIVDSDDNTQEQEKPISSAAKILKESPSKTKPIIGINTDYRPAQKNSSAFCYLHAGYIESVSKAGAIPMLLPQVGSDTDIRRMLTNVDGLIFIGGADLDCRRQGYMLHPSMRLMDHRREEFDFRLMELAAHNHMPIMGIGAGMQLLNVLQGGSLCLHIPEDFPKAIPHLDVFDPNHRHSLIVEDGSLMKRVYRYGDIRVNSMHHMSIDEVAPGFVVTARCPDDIIEAIESTNEDWFAFGTQFHPEHESASTLDRQLFQEFVSCLIEKKYLK